VDDRFVIEWNNIRFINTKEKDVHNFVIMKDSGLLATDSNSVTLNTGTNGVTLMGTATDTSSQTTEGNFDKTLSHFEVNGETGKESIFTKDLGLGSINDIESTFINSLGQRKGNHKKRDSLKSEAGQNMSFKSLNAETYVSDLNTNRLDKYLNDPVVVKMENYLIENKVLDDEVNGNIYNNNNNSIHNINDILNQDKHFLSENKEIKPEFSFKQQVLTENKSPNLAKIVEDHKKDSKSADKLIVCFLVFFMANLFLFISTESFINNYLDKTATGLSAVDKNSIKEYLNCFEVAEYIKLNSNETENVAELVEKDKKLQEMVMNFHKENLRCKIKLVFLLLEIILSIISVLLLNKLLDNFETANSLIWTVAFYTPVVIYLIIQMVNALINIYFKNFKLK
jgi:hypothetical protein